MTDSADTHTLIETLTRFFADNEWPVTPLADESVLQLAFQGTHGRWLCFAQAREDMSQVVFYSVAPVQIPEEKRLAVSEFITRANYGLILGNFELDFADGELRYKTSLDTDGTLLTDQLLQPITFANVSTMDRYLPGLMAVLYGNVPPAAAVEQIEMNVSATD
jgi:hypothetical protein